MIYGGQVANASARHRKQERREVCSVKVAASVYLDWSDRPITFDQGDHLDRGRARGNIRSLSTPSSTTSGSPRSSWTETAASTSSTPRPLGSCRSIYPRSGPVRHLFNEEKRRAIGEEIHKLMAAGFIKEVFHPEWLANPVLVRKKGGKWRMCVDYTGLNKACPKVPYPLPRIDQIVDSTAGCETLSFLDAYSGYHQIRMKEPTSSRLLSSRPLACTATLLCHLV
jgi:hypothetical protein